jgi:hypothetical protein
MCKITKIVWNKEAPKEHFNGRLINLRLFFEKKALFLTHDTRDE